MLTIGRPARSHSRLMRRRSLTSRSSGSAKMSMVSKPISRVMRMPKAVSRPAFAQAELMRPRFMVRVPLWVIPPGPAMGARSRGEGEGAEYGALGAEYRVRCTEYGVLGTEYWVLGTEYWLLPAPHVRSTGYWVRSAGYWLLPAPHVRSTGYWVRSAGYWLLPAPHVRPLFPEAGARRAGLPSSAVDCGPCGGGSPAPSPAPTVVPALRAGLQTRQVPRESPFMKRRRGGTGGPRPPPRPMEGRTELRRQEVTCT